MWNVIFLCKLCSNMFVLLSFVVYAMKIFTFWRGRGSKACRVLRVTSGSHRWSRSLPKRSEFTTERRRWAENHLPPTVTLPRGRKMEMCNWIKKRPSGWFTQGERGGSRSYWGLMENMNKTQKRILSGFYWLFISSDGGFVAEVTGIQQQQSSILIRDDLSIRSVRSADAKSPFKIQMLHDTNLLVQEVIYDAAMISKEQSERQVILLKSTSPRGVLKHHAGQPGPGLEHSSTYINVNGRFPTGEQLG